MGVLADALAWLTDPANHSGPNGIPIRIMEHVQISFQAVLVAALAALPAGVYIGHKRRFETAIVTIGNLGRALPSFGVLGILFGATLSWPGKIGYWPTFIALVLLSIPPILINSFVGIKGVDADLVESARGMGMTESGILRRIKLPLGIPLVLSGLRIASVQSVATATLWGVAGGGAIGRYIVDGFATGRKELLLGGAILVALVAIVTEVLYTLLTRALSPRTSSAGSVDPSGPSEAEAAAAA